MSEQNKKVEREIKYIDYLKEDKPIQGQNYVCLSFLSSENIPNCKLRGSVKVKGVFSTKEEADEHIKKCREDDPDHDIYLGEVGKWLGIPSGSGDDLAEDVQYYEEELQKIAESHKKNLAKAKKLENERKADLLDQAFNETDATKVKKSRDELARENLRKKLEDKKFKQQYLEKTNKQLEATINKEDLSKSPINYVNQKEVQLKEKELNIKEENEKIKQEQQRLKETKQYIKDKDNEVKEQEHNILKIKKLYEKYKEKKNKAENIS